MPIEPRSTESIYQQLRDSLTGSIAALTNFVSGTFNDLFVSAYAEQVREVEIKALAAQLSAYPDYAGKELTQSDLDTLGIDGVDPAEINPYMEDSHLDELGKVVGVTRDAGQRATGTVTLQTSSDTTEIEEGFPVATEADSDERKTYFVDADGDGEIDTTSTETVSPDSGSTEVTVSVIAESVGSEYNVGSDSVTFLPTQSPGVRSVTNDGELNGGADIESNESLRQSIKNAVFENSGGGTRRGVIGAVESRTSFEVDVGVEEFFDATPPYVDVIADVNSGSTNAQEIEDIIEDVRPVGIKHNLVTPAVINIGTNVELVGSDIDTVTVTEEIIEYLTELSVGDVFSPSRLIQRILNVSPGTDRVPAQTNYYTEITDEPYTYDSSVTDYELEYGPLGVIYDEEHRYVGTTGVYELAFPVIDDSTVDVVARVDGERTTLANDTDYNVVDTNGDGDLDTIEFLDGGTKPDEGTNILVSYQHDSWTVDSVFDGSSTYTDGTDYTIEDADGDGAPETLRWDTTNSTPADGATFFVTYETRRSFGGEYNATERERIQADTNEIHLTVVDE